MVLLLLLKIKVNVNKMGMEKTIICQIIIIIPYHDSEFILEHILSGILCGGNTCKWDRYLLINIAF